MVKSNGKLSRDEVPKYLQKNPRYKEIMEECDEVEYSSSMSSDLPRFTGTKETIEDKVIELNKIKYKSYDEPIKKEIKNATEVTGDYGNEIESIVLEKCSNDEFMRATTKSLSLAGFTPDKIDLLIKTEFEHMSPLVKMRKLRNLLDLKLKQYKEENNIEKYEATKMIIDITHTLYPEVE